MVRRAFWGSVNSLSLVIRCCIYVAITFVATAFFTVSTPATGGYFNLGEAAIYLIAVVSPPLVAGIAGGLGPALADLALGYWYFAPATFVIKFCEGYVVSWLIQAIRSGRIPMRNVKIMTFIAGLALSIVPILSLASTSKLGGSVAIVLSSTNVFGTTVAIPTVELDLPPMAWIVIAILFLAFSLLIALLGRGRPYVLPMVVGGSIMVLGYFLYEFFISNPLILHKHPIGALAEVPVNIGQMIAGIVISYPLVHFVERARSETT